MSNLIVKWQISQSNLGRMVLAYVLLLQFMWYGENVAQIGGFDVRARARFGSRLNAERSLSMLDFVYA